MSASRAPEEIRERVRDYLREGLSIEVDDGEDIFAAGFVNSLFAAQLVMFVEDAFGIVVENEEMELANFRSIDAVTDFVARKAMMTRAG
jgi:acyl carrier protein